jgi:hypothetical protein
MSGWQREGKLCTASGSPQCRGDLPLAQRMGAEVAPER